MRNLNVFKGVPIELFAGEALGIGRARRTYPSPLVEKQVEVLSRGAPALKRVSVPCR